MKTAKVQFVPLYFEGQSSSHFQFLSKFSTTLRISMIIREFRNRIVKPLKVHLGSTIPPHIFKAQSERQTITQYLFESVHNIADTSITKI